MKFPGNFLTLKIDCWETMPEDRPLFPAICETISKNSAVVVGDDGAIIIRRQKGSASGSNESGKLIIDAISEDECNYSSLPHMASEYAAYQDPASPRE